MRRTALLLSLLLPLCLHSQSSAVLDGNVVEAATGTPLTNVRARIERLDPIYAKGDPQGHFVFPGLTPGRYELTVESPGYAPLSRVQVDLTSPSARGSVANLGNVKFTKRIAEDGTIHGTVIVPLVGQGAIAGKVTDPYGLPAIASNVEVLLKPAGNANSQPFVRANAPTDDLGQYRFSGLPPGTYWVVASPINRGPATGHDSSQRATYYPGATSLDGASPIVLAAGQSALVDIQIVRVAGVKVSGRIIRPPSVPDATVEVTGAAPRSALYTEVVLMPQGSPPRNMMARFTNGQDDFEIDDVLSGKYTLMAVMSNRSQDGAAGDQAAVAGLLKEVEIGQHDMAGVDLALEPVHDLPGEVTFGEGCQPGPLSIRTAGSFPFTTGQSRAISGADGKFVLTGLTAGRYQIMASWVDRPGPPLMFSSARLGDRDVLTNGFDAPYSGSEPLRIAIDCHGGRRQ
jgi:hypothetical protein